jgi:hypothetical protein
MPSAFSRKTPGSYLSNFLAKTEIDENWNISRFEARDSNYYKAGRQPWHAPAAGWSSQDCDNLHHFRS